MGEVSDSFLVFAKSYKFRAQLDLSLNSECNGLCFIQIGAVEVEISFIICNQQLLRILPNTKPSVGNCKNSSKTNISSLTTPISMQQKLFYSELNDEFNCTQN